MLQKELKAARSPQRPDKIVKWGSLSDIRSLKLRLSILPDAEFWPNNHQEDTPILTGANPYFRALPMTSDDKFGVEFLWTSGLLLKFFIFIHSQYFVFSIYLDFVLFYNSQKCGIYKVVKLLNGVFHGGPILIGS